MEFFYQIVIEKDSNNWIEIGGSLFQDGFAVILEENGESTILDKAPENIKQIKTVATYYFEDKIHEIKNLLQNKLDHDLISVHDLRPVSKPNQYFSIVVLMIIVSIFTLNLWYFGFLDGVHLLLSKTEYAKAEVIKEKLILRKGTYYTKKFEFKYQVEGIDYTGNINAGNRRANINVGDFIKIEYKLKDPSVYSYVGKYVKIRPQKKPNSIEAKRSKDSIY